MPRLKIPAYGKKLLNERIANIHPIDVRVVYGEKWWEIDPPKICIKPPEFEPGKYDFRMLAGLRAIVVDQANAILDLDCAVLPWKFGKFFDLLGELAAADAYVCIDQGQSLVDAQMIAEGSRYFDADRRPNQWPRWWNEELNEKQEKRKTFWLTHQAYELGILERERGRAA